MKKIIYSTSVNICKNGSYNEHIIGLLKSGIKFNDRLLFCGVGIKNKAPNKYYKSLGSQLVNFKLFNIYYLNLFIFDFFMVYKLLKHKKTYDIFYFRPSILTFFQPIFAKLLGYKVIKEINGIYEYELVSNNKSYLSKLTKFFDVISSKISDQLICVSQGVADYQSKFANSNKISVVPNGISVDEISIKNAKIYKSGEVLVIVFVGVLAPWQGVLEFLSLINNYSNKNLIRIEIIGTGIDLKQIENVMLRKSLNIKLHGWVNNKSKIDSIIQNSHIAIIPRQNTEIKGSPLKLFKYMSLGIPILATKIDGVFNLEEVRDEVIFYDYSNQNNLFKEFDNIIFNKKTLPKGSKLKKILKNSYTWSHAYKKIFIND